MRQPVRTLMLVLVVGLAEVATADTLRRRQCAAACDGAIAACVERGYRYRFCRKEVLGLCKLHPSRCAAEVYACQCPTTTTSLPGSTDLCRGAAGCSAEPTGITSVAASSDELRRRLLGSWVLCESSSTLPPVGQPAAGIEFTESGAWYFLNETPDGLRRMTGFNDGGTYVILDTSAWNGPGRFQLNLELNTGSLMIVHWALAERPRLLRLDNNGVQQSLYSHAPDGSPTCSSAE